MLCRCNRLVKEAMYALKSLGLKTDPCGIPVVMLVTSDTLLFMRTTFFQLCEYDVSQALTSPHNP